MIILPPDIVAKIQNTKYKIKYEKFKMQGMTYDYHFLCPMIILPWILLQKYKKKIKKCKKYKIQGLTDKKIEEKN